jgi:L-amino acid N-acyltransferase YncA
MFELAGAVAAEDRWVGAQAPLDRTATIAGWFEALADEQEAVLVVETEGHIVGMAVVHLRVGIASFTMQLADRARGRGLGAELLDAILD